MVVGPEHACLHQSGRAARGQVLSVDDHVTQRELMRQVLEEEGYRVTEAAEGAAALALLRSSEGRFVVLLDYLMPGLDGKGLLHLVSQDALSRPIQIESVPSSLLWLGTFLGFPAMPNQSYFSLNLVGPLEVVIKPLSLLALVVGTLLVCWQVRRGELRLGQGFVAMIAVVLASNKLLSPQYIMWILPLVAYVEGFDLLWLTICALTTLIFPFIYQTRHPILTVPTNPAFLPTITLRNALLVIATVLAVRGHQSAAAPLPDEAEAETPELALAGLERPEVLAERSAALLEEQGAAQEGRKPLVKMQ